LAGLVNNGAQVPGLDPAVFKGKVSVVNVLGLVVRAPATTKRRF